MFALEHHEFESHTLILILTAPESKLMRLLDVLVQQRVHKSRPVTKW